MSTDVAEPVPHFPHLAGMVRDLNGRAIAREETGESIATQIMEQILAADTFEDLFRAQEAGTVAGKNYTDRPFILRPENVEWRRSRDVFIEAGGFPFFFFARVQDVETGDEIVINCGGQTVVAMMYKLTTSPQYWTDAPDGRMFSLRSNSAAESDFEYLTIHPVRSVASAPATGKRGR